MVECTLSVTHCLRLNLQLYTIDLVRTCRISSFCTVAWQLARFQLTRRITRSLGDSWASWLLSCHLILVCTVMKWVMLLCCRSLRQLCVQRTSDILTVHRRHQPAGDALIAACRCLYETKPHRWITRGQVSMSESIDLMSTVATGLVPTVQHDDCTMIWNHRHLVPTTPTCWLADLPSALQFTYYLLNLLFICSTWSFLCFRIKTNFIPKKLIFQG